jgi:internalin A
MKKVFTLLMVQSFLWGNTATLSFQPSTAVAKPAPTNKIKSFNQWCQEKNSVPKDTKNTIDTILAILDTDSCKVADSKLRGMRELELREMDISDLKPIASLTNLTTLIISDVQSGQVSNLQPLASLNKLTTLILDNNQIINLQPLAGLTNLKTLSLRKNKISNLKPLARLNKLINLSLEENEISDLQPLVSLNKLKELTLADNPIDKKICPVQPASVCQFE